MAGNPLLDPGQQLSGPALLAAAKALVSAQYGGALSELGRQIGQNQQQAAGAQKATAGYFDQLGHYGQQALGAEGQIAGDLNSQLSGIARDTQQGLGQIGQDAQGQMAKYSPGMQGSQQPGAQALAQELARQQGQAGQQQGAFRAQGALQGANYRGLAAANLGTYAQMGQERLGQIGQAGQLANQPLNAKIAALREQEGPALTKYLGQLRQQEITNRITEQGLGLKQQSLASTAAYNQARISATIRGQNVSLSESQARSRVAQLNAKLRAQGLSESQRHHLAQEKIAWTRALNAGSGKAGGLPKTTPTGSPTLTPDRQQRYFDQLDNLPSLIRQMQQPLSPKTASALGVAPGTKLSGQQIRTYLASGNNPSRTRYDSRLVDAGFALAGWGYLTPSQITELNKMGLIVGSRYKRGQAPKPKKGVLGAHLFGISV